MTLGALAFLFSTVSIGHASLIRRGIQSNASCSSDYSWTDNQQGLSPCVVAAFVIAACKGSAFIVSQLPPSSHYSISPNQADLCSCSWASYNLLAACTACQGQPQSILNWAAYHDNCTGDLSDTTYFPPDTPIQGDTKIPFWATTNPSTWANGNFNLVQAKTLANEGKADVGPPSTQLPTKKTPVGAIAGGVVGGIVVIALGVAAAFMMYSRHRKANAAGVHQRPPMHGRSFSDLSQKTTGTIYGQHVPTLETIPGSPTNRSNGSTHTLSYYGSPRTSVFSAPLQTFRQTFSPNPADPQGSIIPPPPVENQITPFVVNYTQSPPSPGSPVSLHRKMASESSDTTQPTTRYDDTSVDGHGATPSRRLNPPPYAPSVHSLPEQPYTPGHRVISSLSSQVSFTSSQGGSHDVPYVPASRIAMTLSGAGRIGTPVNHDTIPEHDNEPDEVPLA